MAVEVVLEKQQVIKKNISFAPNPTADAGSDQTICALEIVALNGNATNHVSSRWTSSGDGTFVNANNLLTSYTPGPADRIAGSVNLTLRANSGAPCNTFDEDVMTVFINPIPVVNAGPDQTSCESGEFEIELASASNYSSLQWTSTGSGSFGNAPCFKQAISQHRQTSPMVL